MAQIRPFQFFNAQGQPLANGKIYVTKSGKNPSDPLALLKITDAQSGEVFGGTFRTDAFGFPIGVNGNRINPTVSEDSWGLFVEDADGGTVYQYSRQVSDNFGQTDDASSYTVDAVSNNLDLAKLTDLTGMDYIFIQSETTGWEVTDNGPVNSFYAHRTGLTGAPSTGDKDKFYDVVGNEFRMSSVSVATYDVQTPTGATMQWWTATPPAGWLLLRGQAVSRAAYPALFSVLGITFGNGDGTTTFNLPDTRGLVLRGVDAGSGVDPDAATRTDRGDLTIGDAVGTKQDDELKGHVHSTALAEQRFGVGGGSNMDFVKRRGSLGGGSNITVNTSTAGGAETRMKNIYVNYIIKT